MKTTRQLANRKKLIANFAFASGLFISFVIAKNFEIELTQNTKYSKLLLVSIPFVLGFIIKTILERFIKCAACGGDISQIIVHSGGFFAASKKIKFCPCCGASLDTNR